MSGIGKGIAVSSIGRVLKSKGFKVTAIKIDPYINVDAGTMNPIEHGEVFVTEDGVECDQDVGNYERFLDENIYTDNYITTGRVYQSVIQKERNLEYEGRSVEVVPDIPNEVIRRIKKAGNKTKSDIVLVEIGGTVGDYQNIVFLEAARMMRLTHHNDVLFVLVGYLPIPSSVGEMKTKPTQYAVRTLNASGIHPEMILARSDVPLDDIRKEKLSIFCNIAPEDVISAPDIDSVYQVPLNFEKEELGNRILSKLHLEPIRKKNMTDWRAFVDKVKTAKDEVRIGIVGKYFETGRFALMDSYISVIESIKHAGYNQNKKPVITWLASNYYEKDKNKLKELDKYDGIIVPGGFGKRGVEGKIEVIRYCRENKIPFFGLCLGMQLATIEFARNVCNLDAHSREFTNKGDLVIDIMESQKKNILNSNYGGTMRLGAYDCALTPDTISARSYEDLNISERHRHRYELNNHYRQALEEKGLIIAGINKKNNLVEIIELKDHPFFVGTQFHPEFKSRPTRPHPLFTSFIKAAIKK